mgnify:FL=1
MQELRTAFQAFLPAALDVEDAEYAAADVAEFGTAIVLLDVVTFRFEDYEEWALQNLPALLILHRDTQTEHWMTAEATLIHDVDVIAVVAETDPERLARRVWRTGEAIRRVMSQRAEGTGATGDPIYQVDEAGSDMGPLTDDLIPGGLVKGVRLRYRLHEVEARP